MICRLLNRRLGFQCDFRSVVSFLDRLIFSRAMGCLLGCFRVRDDDRRLHRAQILHPREAVTSHNRLSSLFLSEEKEDSQFEARENVGMGSPQIDKELRDEAKFLKACGTIPETPVEIRKAFGKLNGSPPFDSDPSKFNSWLPNTTIKKLQMDSKPDQPLTPTKVFEDWSKVSGCSEYTPSSCISQVQNLEDDGAGSVNKEVKIQINQTDDIATSVSPYLSTTNGRGKTKSVHFECNFDGSSTRSSASGNIIQDSKRIESPGNQSVTKRSANPTPQKLSDDMQTPGTFFSAYLDNAANGKNRIRSQYVYSVLNPVENVLKDDDSNSHQLSGEDKEYHEQPGNANPNSEERVNETSVGKESKEEASLSSWLKPLPATQDGVLSRGHPPFGRTPGDRPIIGMVAAHWNEDEPSHISPKWWDGNGIPNSTNKYKEDQKVSWHATPFEERLEKALSEEGVISQRKHINGRPIVFDENDESDTALSELQSSTQPRSVVSF